MTRRDLLSTAAVPFLAVPALTSASASAPNPERLQPWRENPSYWQHKGKPVLLLGGSDDDNLFQWPAESLINQLDKLKAAGGNYVRNTMSDRGDKGFEVYPFLKLPDGRYDLEQWNPEYWSRFERFVRWTGERDIIVQIEVWDRFDYSRENWLPHPYNPKNNLNYGYPESGFEPEYPAHPGRNLQPFFFTTPKQRNNGRVFKYQKRFVDKMLSYTLRHGHVLYCMDNETSGEEEWSRFWAAYIKQQAKQAGSEICVTEMWDDWDLKADRHRRTFDHPELYDFVDVSQNNHNSGDKHWDNALWVRNRILGKPRPVNSVKIYGADGNKFGHTDQDAIERFWRNLLAGCASSRFHRPESGLGLNHKAQAAIRSARAVESLVRFWELAPASDLLSGRRPNTAYAAARPDEAYVVYLPSGGGIGLDVPAGSHAITWIDCEKGERGPTVAGIRRAGSVELTAPGSGNWLAVVRTKTRGAQ
jgi:hypothetical protein